jgi:hypothetical protein
MANALKVPLAEHCSLNSASHPLQIWRYIFIDTYARMLPLNPIAHSLPPLLPIFPLATTTHKSIDLLSLSFKSIEPFRLFDTASCGSVDSERLSWHLLRRLKGPFEVTWTVRDL